MGLAQVPKLGILLPGLECIFTNLCSMHTLCMHLFRLYSYITEGKIFLLILPLQTHSSPTLGATQSLPAGKVQNQDRVASVLIHDFA